MENPSFKKPGINPYTIALIILFLIGLVLLIAEIKIFHDTFIAFTVPAAVCFFTGLIVAPFLSKWFAMRYYRFALFVHVIYGIGAFGGIAVYAFMASNFYFSKGHPVVYKAAIVKTGEPARGSDDCNETYAEIVYNGMEKQVMFACGTPVENYRTLELKIEKGFWGYDVIKGGSLMDEKKGDLLALKPMNYNVFFDSTSYSNTPLKLTQLGELNMPTGKIIVGDPLVTIYDSDPLKTQIEPGKYPVIACIAKTEKSGDRYAVVKLEISKNRAVKWELALTAKQNLSDLKGDQTFGFAVDAGLGCFVDMQTRDLFNQYDAASTKKDKNWNIYDDVLAAAFKKNAANPKDPDDAGDWVNFYLPGMPTQNIIMFQSGFGDGYYASYWGLDDKGKVCSLVIDFAVL